MSLMAVATMASTSSCEDRADGVSISEGTRVVAAGGAIGGDSQSPIPMVGMVRVVASVGKGIADIVVRIGSGAKAGGASDQKKLRQDDSIFGAISYTPEGEAKGVTENGISFVIGCIKV